MKTLKKQHQIEKKLSAVSAQVEAGKGEFLLIGCDLVIAGCNAFYQGRTESLVFHFV